MFKYFEHIDYTIMNGITKKSIFFVPNGHQGKLRSYHIIDAVTLNTSHKDGSHTFALLEHEELGEDDCIVVKLAANHKHLLLRREDDVEWRDSGSSIAYFIPAGNVIVGASYNGLDDLEDEGWDLTDAFYWTDEEINAK